MNGATQQAQRDWKRAKRDWNQAKRDWDQARRDWKQAGPDWEQARQAWEQARQARQQAMQAWKQGKQAWEQARRAWEPARPVWQWVEQVRKWIKQDRERVMQKSAGQYGEQFKDFLGWLSPSRITALYALALVTSAISEFGIYFPTLGISVYKAPIIISDIIRSSVIWFPPFFIAAIVAIAFFWFPNFAPKINHKLSTMNPIGKFFAAAGMAVVVCAFFALMSYTVIYSTSHWIFEGALNQNGKGFWYGFRKSLFVRTWITLIWAFAILIFFGYFLINPKAPNRILTMLINFVYFAIFAYFIGYFTHFKADSDRRMALTTQNQPILIRSFEKYLLIGQCKNLEFVNVDQVERLKVLKNKGNKDGKIIVMLENADEELTCPQNQQKNSPSPPVASWLLQLSAGQR